MPSNVGQFKPGNVANPSGANGNRKLSKQLAEKLVHNVENAAKFVEKSLNSKDPARQEWATELIFNRVFGKAQEHIEISGDSDNPIQFVSERPLTAAQFLLQYAPEPEDIEADA